MVYTWFCAGNPRYKSANQSKGVFKVKQMYLSGSLSPWQNGQNGYSLQQNHRQAACDNSRNDSLIHNGAMCKELWGVNGRPDERQWRPMAANDDCKPEPQQRALESRGCRVMFLSYEGVCGCFIPEGVQLRYFVSLQKRKREQIAGLYRSDHSE